MIASKAFLASAVDAYPVEASELLLLFTDLLGSLGTRGPFDTGE